MNKFFKNKQKLDEEEPKVAEDKTDETVSDTPETKNDDAEKSEIVEPVVEEEVIAEKPAGTLDSKSALKIGKKAFILGFCIILALMIVAFVLTKVIPQGHYLTNEAGEYINDESGTPIFEFSQGDGMPFWKFLLSPFLAMNPKLSGASTIYLILALLLVIGGVFNVLDKSGALNYLLSKIVHKYKGKNLALLAVVCLIFMVLGSTIGMMEETIPFVPVMIMLCYSLGLDSICALAMTLLAAGMGFSAGVMNPFTTIISLELGGMTVVDGIWIRLIVFALVYGVLMLCLLPYAKKIMKNPEKSIVWNEDEKARAELMADMRQSEFEKNPQLDKALKWFVMNIIVMVIFVVLALFIKKLQSAITIVIVVVYVSCGIGAGVIAKTPVKKMLKQFATGAISVAPAIIMIMMASSVKYIITEGGVMDSILYYTVGLMNKTPGVLQPILLYLVVFILNFFISSGSAKASLLMPILFPISDMAGISRIVTVTAFLFGDGFSNMLFPTNGALLIALALSPVSYGKWFKWTFKLQAALLVLSCCVLMAVNAIY